MNTGKWIDNAFFGLHFDLHANEHDALGSEVTFEHIYAELSKVKPDFVQYDCKGHPGYAGYPTKVGVPAPGIEKDALSVWRAVTRKLGIPLLVHYSGIWDEQAGEMHPEWTTVAADGTGSKHLHCCNSAYTGAYMIPQMLEVIDRYDIDGFWVDGENWAAAPCYCERCIELFTQETGISDIPRAKGEPRWNEWLQFHRRSFEKHVRLYTEAVHQKKPECLVCSNWMYSVRQPDDISVPVDYLSGDFTPAFGCERAAIEGRFLASRGMAWNLMAWGSYGNDLPIGGFTYPAWTFKTAEHLQQESAEVIMNGGGMLVYDTPQRSGHLIGWRQDILAEVAAFCRERQSVCLGTESLPQVALLHNTADFYDNNDPLYNLGTASQPLEAALQLLLENHCHVDIVNDTNLLQNIGKYPMVCIPEPMNVSGQLLDACKDYVADGGHLLVSGGNGASIFGELLGVETSGEPVDGVYSMQVGKEAVSAKGLWQMVETAGADVIGYLCKGEEPVKDRLEYPAATINCYGKGKTAGIYGPLFGFYFNNPYPRLRKFFGSIIEELHNPDLIRVEAPARVEISVRARENAMMVHMLNRGSGHPLSPKNSAVEDIPPVGPIKITVPLAREPERVYTAPDGTAVASEWRSGRLEVLIPSLHIHNVLIIER